MDGATLLPSPLAHMGSTRAAVFVLRCAGAATVAYELASALGLPAALWAAMSAVIVSQERLHDTRSSLTARILGTLVGIAVTVVVSEAASRVAASVAIAFHRGGEVILGALVGWAFHWAAERLLDGLSTAARTRAGRGAARRRPHDA